MIDTHDDSAPVPGTFGDRLRWALKRHPTGDHTWEWLAAEMKKAPGLVRRWGSRKAKMQPHEKHVAALCDTLSLSPAWLRYGIGSPYRDGGGGPGTYPAAQALVEDVADEMGGLAEEEIAAEVVRRAVRRKFSRTDFRRAVRSLEQRLFPTGEDEHAPREDASRTERS